jgi:hypothetical protein
MPIESHRASLYQSVVKHAENHTFAAYNGGLTTTDETIELVHAALTALEGGLTHDDITDALHEGEGRGQVLYRNCQSVPDRAYWEAVRDEAEAFWANRYNPNAKEDW